MLSVLRKCCMVQRSRVGFKVPVFRISDGEMLLEAGYEVESDTRVSITLQKASLVTPTPTPARNSCRLQCRANLKPYIRIKNGFRASVELIEELLVSLCARSLYWLFHSWAKSTPLRSSGSWINILGALISLIDS
jgi:hypothetical protein